MTELLMTRAELIAERELSAAAIARLTAERNAYVKQCRDLLNKIERLQSDKATFERWYAVAIKEVTRLRDELEMVSK